MDEHFPTISDSNIKGYKASYKLCEPITRKRFVDITLDDLQYLVDVSGKNTPTLRKLKSMLGLVFKYAVIHDIIPPDRNKVQYLDIKKQVIQTPTTGHDLANRRFRHYGIRKTVIFILTWS